jgi:hypothetical protein
VRRTTAGGVTPAGGVKGECVMKAKSNESSGTAALDELPTAEGLWNLLPVSIKQSPDVRTRLAAVARQRYEDVKKGYFGDVPLPKEMPREDRWRLEYALNSFWWAMSVIGFRPEYSARTAIEHLIPPATSAN